MDGFAQNLFQGISLRSIALGLLAGFTIAFFTLEHRSGEGCAVEFSADATPSENTNIAVDLAGAVHKPGIYELASGSRVGDLLSSAGGIQNDISKSWVSKYLNTSAFLTDEQKVYVPFEWELYEPKDEYVVSLVSKSGSAGPIQPEVVKVDSSSSNTGSLINVNLATLDELDTLPGIGESYGEKIIGGRPYKDFSELETKSGVPKTTLTKLQDLITY